MIEFAAKKELTASKEKIALELSERLKIELTSARLLVLRGIETADDALRFLHPSEDDMHDPFLFAHMRGCMERIDQALTLGQKITIYSDYDADGTTAGAILYMYLQSLQADVHIYTPHRHKEGYGLNKEAVQKIADDGTKLLITVDCGITNFEEVELAKNAGVDVIISDHHECPEILPARGFYHQPQTARLRIPFPAFMRGRHCFQDY